MGSSSAIVKIESYSESIGVEISCGEGVAELMSDIKVLFSHVLSFVPISLIGDEVLLVNFVTNGLAERSAILFKQVVSDICIMYISAKPFVDSNFIMPRIMNVTKVPQKMMNIRTFCSEYAFPRGFISLLGIISW